MPRVSNRYPMPATLMPLVIVLATSAAAWTVVTAPQLPAVVSSFSIPLPSTARRRDCASYSSHHRYSRSVRFGTNEDDSSSDDDDDFPLPLSHATSPLSHSSASSAMPSSLSSSSSPSSSPSVQSNPSSPSLEATNITAGNTNTDNNNNENNKNDNTPSFLRPLIRILAQLSLRDYHWRSNVFATNQADRQLADSLARIRGETAPYVRPMDASTPGPLGRWEETSVAWLGAVFAEERRRAQRMVELERWVRPSEAGDSGDSSSNSAMENSRGSSNIMARSTDATSTTTTTSELGPLGLYEQAVTEFLTTIFRAEQERVRTQTWRPKDLDAALRGPLGRLELDAVQTLQRLQESETLRGQLSQRAGTVVRPMDIPGPLGEWELSVAQVVTAERRRAQERKRMVENNNNTTNTILRPKDASVRGPLGEAELQAYDTIRSLSEEEMERLRNIYRALQENRPMENNRESVWGTAEAVLVGLVRAPRLLLGVVTRVQELWTSATLPDQERLLTTMTKQGLEEDGGMYQDDERNDDDDDDDDDDIDQRRWRNRINTQF